MQRTRLVETPSPELLDFICKNVRTACRRIVEEDVHELTVLTPGYFEPKAGDAVHEYVANFYPNVGVMHQHNGYYLFSYGRGTLRLARRPSEESNVLWELDSARDDKYEPRYTWDVDDAARYLSRFKEPPAAEPDPPKKIVSFADGK